jgi:hypothetical protein
LIQIILGQFQHRPIIGVRDGFQIRDIFHSKIVPYKIKLICDIVQR